MSKDEDRSFLSQAYLIVAGIRVFTHREGKPPSAEELAEFLKTSTELIYHMANRLEREGILRSVKTSFETKYYLKAPHKLKDLPEEAIPDLDEEIQKVRARKKKEQKKLDATFAAKEIRHRQKERMAELEKKMKKGLSRPKSPWAD